MASFKGDGRDRKPGRRRGASGVRRSRPGVESLEDRQLLDGAAPQAWQPSNGNLADVVNGPMANAGQVLNQVYQEYQAYLASGGRDQFHTSAQNTYRQFIYFGGDWVGVSVQGRG